MADWYEFQVDTSVPAGLGGPITNYQQNTRLTFTEQQGPFFRGKEYYADSSEPTGWKFVANLYGIMSRSGRTDDNGLYSVRINEWLNEEPDALQQSIETVGVFTGVMSYNSSTSPDHDAGSVPEIAVEYTGQTKARNKFGAQHFVAKMQ